MGYEVFEVQIKLIDLWHLGINLSFCDKIESFLGPPQIKSAYVCSTLNLINSVGYTNCQQ